MAWDNWMTPPDVLELARQAMGSIDFDPASNFTAQQYVKAKSFCTLEQYYTPKDTYYEGIRMYDGLSQFWHGNVFCNPPYSAGNIDSFVRKAIEEWDTSNVKQMIFLVNSATDSAWYHLLLDRCNCVLLWRGRIKFWKIFDGRAHEKWEGEKSKQEGKGKIGNSPRYLNTLFYFGYEKQHFRDTFEGKGTFLEVI